MPAKPEPVCTPREADLGLLREHLRLARNAGMRFGQAWPIACESVAPTLPAMERRNWIIVLVETRPEWECAYELRGRYTLTADLLTDD